MGIHRNGHLDRRSDELSDEAMWEHSDATDKEVRLWKWETGMRCPSLCFIPKASQVK